MPEQIPDINVPEITPVITSFIMIFVKFIRNTAALIPNERNIARSDFIFLPIIKIILKMITINRKIISPRIIYFKDEKHWWIFLSR